jgi:hypothetical protein
MKVGNVFVLERLNRQVHKGRACKALRIGLLGYALKIYYQYG